MWIETGSVQSWVRQDLAVRFGGVVNETIPAEMLALVAKPDCDD